MYIEHLLDTISLKERDIYFKLHMNYRNATPMNKAHKKHVMERYYFNIPNHPCDTIEVMEHPCYVSDTNYVIYV